MLPPAVYLVMSAFLLALGSVLTKGLLSHPGMGGPSIDPLPCLTLQLLGGVTFLVILHIASHIARRGPRLALHLWRRPILAGLIQAGLILGLGSIGTITALALIPASEASVVFATQPVVMLLLARVLLHERFDAGIAGLCGCAVCGVVLIVGAAGADLSGARLFGLAFAGLSTLCAALYVVWMRGLSGEIDPRIALTLVLSVASGVAALSWGVAHAAQLAQTGTGTASVAVSAFATGAIHYGAAFYVYLLGLKNTDASKAGIYLNLVPVFVILLAWAVLSERFLPWQWVGAAIVIASVAVVSWRMPAHNSGS